MRLPPRILLPLIAAALSTTSHAQQPTGQQIVQSMLANFPQKDFLCEARLTFASGSNAEQNVDVQIQTRNAPDSICSAVVVTAPTNLQGNAILSVFRKGSHAIYRKMPGSKDPHTLAPSELSESFVGTDFAFEDLDFGFLRWPEPKLVGEKRRQTRACYVVESTPAKDQSGQYGKVVSWIDKENLMLMLAEGDGTDGKLVK